MALEEWATMLARHHREKCALILALRNQGLTQTQAAARLKVLANQIMKFTTTHRLPWGKKN